MTYRSPGNHFPLFCVAAFFALALAGCSSLGLSPIAMPTGYTYENEIYHTPPGPEANAPVPAKTISSGQNIGTQPDGAPAAGAAVSTVPPETARTPAGHDLYTASATMDSTGHWDAAADELVGKIMHDLGRPMEKVGVPGNDAFADAMKDSLRRHKIPVMDHPGEGPFVIHHKIEGSVVTIDFYSNRASILTESGATPQ